MTLTVRRLSGWGGSAAPVTALDPQDTNLLRRDPCRALEGIGFLGLADTGLPNGIQQNLHALVVAGPVHGGRVAILAPMRVGVRGPLAPSGLGGIKATHGCGKFCRRN